MRRMEDWEGMAQGYLGIGKVLFSITKYNKSIVITQRALELGRLASTSTTSTPLAGRSKEPRKEQRKEKGVLVIGKALLLLAKRYCHEL